MASIHIHVPDKLKAIMAKHKLNWSHHACNAFMQAIALEKASLARYKEGSGWDERSAVYHLEQMYAKIKQP